MTTDVKMADGTVADSTVVREGETVVLYTSHSASAIVKLSSGATFRNEFGKFDHSSIVGRRYGDRIQSTGAGNGSNRGSGGWVLVLRLTPELWTRFLPHRTQVLYSADIASIVFNLGVAPGSVVVESGTGSASLTYSLARAAGRTGRVYTFEFHEIRAAEAKTALAQILSADGAKQTRGNVTVTHVDACSPHAFANPSDGKDLRGAVDAVFLDLPSPWLAVANAYEVLRYGGAICNFSPCIEQVQRVCAELQIDGRFHMVRTIETLDRPYNTKRVQVPRLDVNIAEAIKRQQNKRPRRDAAAVEEDVGGDEEDDFVEEDKKKKEPETVVEVPAMSVGNDSHYTTRPVTDIKGHTGYLTFAIKAIPAPTNEDDAAAPAPAPSATEISTK